MSERNLGVDERPGGWMLGWMNNGESRLLAIAYCIFLTHQPPRTQKSLSGLQHTTQHERFTIWSRVRLYISTEDKCAVDP